MWLEPHLAEALRLSQKAFDKADLDQLLDDFINYQAVLEEKAGVVVFNTLEEEENDNSL